MARALFAFTRDLRLSDHAGLAAAARHGDIVPVLVIDVPSSARLRRSPRRAAWYCAAVRSLDADLRSRGSSLIVRRGKPGPVLRGLARAAGAGVVGWSCGYDAKTMRGDRDLQSALEEAGLRALPVHDQPAVPPEDSAAGHRGGDGYRAFVPYFAQWRTLVPTPDAGSATFAAHDIASEALPQPEEFGAEGIDTGPAGEAHARRTLGAFLALPVLHYGGARNVPAACETSRLSGALSFGLLAAREVVRATCDRASDPFLMAEERSSIRLFLRALAQAIASARNEGDAMAQAAGLHIVGIQSINSPSGIPMAMSAGRFAPNVMADVAVPTQMSPPSSLDVSANVSVVYLAQP